MATDVVQKVISANDLNNGAALVHNQKNGTYQTLDAENKRNGSLDAVESVLTSRFDESTYYTA